MEPGVAVALQLSARPSDPKGVEKLLGAGILVLIASSAVVGTRLVLLARRTREIPELAHGSAFLLLGVVGYPLSIMARQGLTGSPDTAGILLAAALAAQDLASLAILVGTGHTFRRRSGWLPGLIPLVAALFAASLVGHGLTVGFGGARDGGAFYYLGFWLRAGPFFWAAGESTRYWRIMRRRVRIGVADPIVANRFGLWALASSALSAGFLVFLWGRLTSDNVGQDPFVLALTSVVGLVAGAASWLAFVPPRFHVRRLVADEPASGLRSPP